MNRFLWTAAVTAVICGGCSIGDGRGAPASPAAGESSTAHVTTQLVRGSVSPAERRLENARVMAIDTDRHVYASAVAAGRPYRIVIANTMRSATRRAIGHLIVGTSRWAVLNPSRPVVDLGVLHPTSTATSALGIRDEKTDLRGSGGDDSATSSADAGEDEQHKNETVVEEQDDLCGQAAKDATDDTQQDADIALTSGADPASVASEDKPHQGDDEPLKPCGPDERGDSTNDGGAAATDTHDEPNPSGPADASPDNAPDDARGNALPGAGAHALK
jgi:hypothetical protein